MEGVAFSLGCSWHTNSGFWCGISDILTTPRLIPPPHTHTHYHLYISPVSMVSLRQARVVLGVGGSYEDSLRPRRGKRGWREFFRT